MLQSVTCQSRSSIYFHSMPLRLHLLKCFKVSCDKAGVQYIGSQCLSSCLFVCLFGFLMSSSTTRLYRGRAPRQERLTILRAATHETELGDHDFCLSRSHYTDTDPTCRERAATAGIEPGTSSPGVARSTAELPRPPLKLHLLKGFKVSCVKAVIEYMALNASQAAPVDRFQSVMCQSRSSIYWHPMLYLQKQIQV